MLEAPKPTSSVIISRTLGAPLGASMALGKSGVESFAVRPILPLNGCSGTGRTIRSPAASLCGGACCTSAAAPFGGCCWAHAPASASAQMSATAARFGLRVIFMVVSSEFELMVVPR